MKFESMKFDSLILSISLEISFNMFSDLHIVWH